MFGARQKRTDALAKNCFSPQRDCIKRSTMKGIPHRNGFEFSGCVACQFQGHANRTGAAGCKQYPVQVTGGQLGKSLREVYRRKIRKSSRTKRKLVQLFFYSLNDIRMPKADLMYAIAMKIQIFVSLKILNE